MLVKAYIHQYYHFAVKCACGTIVICLVDAWAGVLKSGARSNTLSIMSSRKSGCAWGSSHAKHYFLLNMQTTLQLAMMKMLSPECTGWCCCQAFTMSTKYFVFTNDPLGPLLGWRWCPLLVTDFWQCAGDQEYELVFLKSRCLIWQCPQTWSATNTNQRRLDTLGCNVWVNMALPAR